MQNGREGGVCAKEYVHMTQSDMHIFYWAWAILNVLIEDECSKLIESWSGQVRRNAFVITGDTCRMLLLYLHRHTFPCEKDIYFLSPFFKVKLWPIWGIGGVIITFLLKIISTFILFLGQIIRHCCHADQIWS